MIGSIFVDCTNPENEGKSLLMKKYLDRVTFNNITRLTFGKRFENVEGVIDEQGLKLKGILANGLKLDDFGVIMDHKSWLQRLLSFNTKASTKHISLRDKLVKQIIEEYRHTLQKNGEDETINQHLLHALLTIQDLYDLDDDIIVGLLWDMIVMGMDTIVASVEWALAELIKNSRLQKKAQDELDRVIGSDRIMTEWDYSNLPYLRCIVKEGLRLHPPTPFLLPHKAHAHVKIGGYDIPTASNVLINVRGIARDPSIWKNPLEFKPERFMEEDVDLKGHDFRFLPFGSGRRACPGAQLGFNLVTSILGHLLHHFNWAPADGLMQEDIDMSEKLGFLAQMQTPLQAFAIPRLPECLYRRIELKSGVY
ncbi:cytochrome P450 98A3-like [Silene latifolia]|uniref:cytochrome P450 98A3-like n=1 Tax=Silene latifolia TaxID=37657 RepID=UPI003D76A4A5